MKNNSKNNFSSRPEFYFYRRKIVSRVVQFVDAWGYHFFKSKKNTLNINGKILVVNLGGVGDIILSEPLLSSLLSLNTVDLVCSPGNEQGLLDLVKINKIFYLSLPWSGGKNNLSRSLLGLWRLSYQLKKGEYAAAFDIKGDPAVILLLWLARIRQRVGFNNGGLGFLLTTAISQPRHIHRSKINLALLRPITEKFFYQARAPYLPFATDKNFLFSKDNYCPERLTITVHIGASATARLWPLDYWEKLLLLLVNNYNIVVIGGLQESDDFNNFSDKIKRSVISLCGCRWQDTANALKNSVLFIGSNSGPGHLAAALGCQVISLFSTANDPVEWAPSGAKVLTFQGECAGCEKSICEDNVCLKRILPKDVAILIGETCKVIKNKIKIL